MNQRRRHLVTWLVVLAIAAGCGPSTPSPPVNPESPMPPTGTSETPPNSGTPEPSRDVDSDERDARAMVESYVQAVTAVDEPAAARFTCRKKDGGLLWIGAVGRPITVLSVSVAGSIARAVIQVEGKPKSPLTLRKVDGAWCVWL